MNKVSSFDEEKKTPNVKIYFGHKLSNVGVVGEFYPDFECDTFMAFFSF